MICRHYTVHYIIMSIFENLIYDCMLFTEIRFNIYLECAINNFIRLMYSKYEKTTRCEEKFIIESNNV